MVMRDRRPTLRVQAVVADRVYHARCFFQQQEWLMSGINNIGGTGNIYMTDSWPRLPSGNTACPVCGKGGDDE